MQSGRSYSLTENNKEDGEVGEVEEIEAFIYPEDVEVE